MEKLIQLLVELKGVLFALTFFLLVLWLIL